MSTAVVDPDLELRGAGFDLLAMLAFLLSVISAFFTQHKRAGGRPTRASSQDPPLLICKIPSHPDSFGDRFRVTPVPQDHETSEI